MMLAFKAILSRTLVAACAVTALAAGAAHAQSAHAARQAGPLVFHYGLVPSELVLAHRDGHAERTMHEAGARPGGSHLVLAIFSRSSGRRIADADVSATVSLRDVPAETRQLQPMTIAGQPGFGGFFDLGAAGIYTIRFEARAREAGTGMAEFEHRVPGPEAAR